MSNDAMMRAVLRAMGKLIESEIGPGVAFALFVDWRDGRPLSYLSNGTRIDIVAALEEWLGRIGRRERTLAVERGETPAIQNKCAELGKSMVEEDIDVVLFLFTNGEEGETAWFSSLANGPEVVASWVATERGLL
jgi:hypothetical protein